MRLKKLSLQNIRSYTNEEIIFPEGSVLLAGDTGAGKTSLLLAIEYALFGLQPGQKGSYLLRNNINTGSVSLELEIDGKDILIERKLKRNNKSVTNEHSAITIGGKRIESSLTEIKIKILEALGYPQEFVKKNNLLYRYTVYTPQEQMKQIILEDEETRLNILRHILSIDKYRIIKENLTIILNRLKEDSKVLQGEIKTLDEEKNKFKLKNQFLNELEKSLIQKTKDLKIKIEKRKTTELELLKLEAKIKEKEHFKKEIEKTNIMLATKRENLSAINFEISELEKTTSDSEEIFNEGIYKNVLSEIEKKNKIIESLNLKYSNLIGEVNSLESNKEENMRKIERIFKIEICPTCLQDVLDNHKHNILNETEKVVTELKKRKIILEKEISKISETLNREKPEKEKLERKKSSLEILQTRLEYAEKAEKKLQNIQKTKENLKKDVSLLNKHIELLKNQVLEFSKFENLFKLKKEEMQDAFQSERQAEISLAELKKENDLIKKEIYELKETINIKEMSKRKLSNIIELSDWLSSSFTELISFTERNVLLKLRGEFSRTFSKWFQMLVSEEALNVRLDESFSPIIMHNETEMEYSFLSGGERTAISLAYRLALNQTVNSILSKLKTKEIVILDEPTDGFSEAQLDRMRYILEELNVSQLIIVSHEQKIESFVDNIIRIKKVGDVSSLEMPSSLLTIRKTTNLKYF